MQPTDEQKNQAERIYRQIYWWVFLNARGSGWLDISLPEGAIGKLAKTAVDAAVAVLLADIS